MKDLKLDQVKIQHHRHTGVTVTMYRIDRIDKTYLWKEVRK